MGRHDIGEMGGSVLGVVNMGCDVTYLKVCVCGVLPYIFLQNQACGSYSPRICILRE